MNKDQYEFDKKHKSDVKGKKKRASAKRKKRINVRKEKHGG